LLQKWFIRLKDTFARCIPAFVGMTRTLPAGLADALTCRNDEISPKALGVSRQAGTAADCLSR